MSLRSGGGLHSFGAF